MHYWALNVFKWGQRRHKGRRLSIEMREYFLFIVLISVVLYSIFNVSTIINAVKREILYRWALNVLYVLFRI